MIGGDGGTRPDRALPPSVGFGSKGCFVNHPANGHKFNFFGVQINDDKG